MVGCQLWCGVLRFWCCVCMWCCVGVHMWCCVGVCMWCCVGVCMWCCVCMWCVCGVCPLFSPSPLPFSCLVSLLTCLFLFFFFSFLFSLLSFILSFIFSFIFSFTAHTETTSDRQVTLPTKNGHAPRDPLNQERAINLSILAMSHPGKFSRVESD